MSRYMRRRDSIPETKTLRIPADVFSPASGEDVRVWDERWKQWWRDRDFARGMTVYAPDGSLFFASNGEDARAILPVFDRAISVRRGQATTL